MNRCRIFALGTVLIAACTTTSDSAAQLELSSKPLLLEYQTGDSGHWNSPTGTIEDDGSVLYRLSGSGDLEIVIVCQLTSGFYTQELLSTTSEWNSIAKVWPYQACPATDMTVPNNDIKITGQMAQAGAVFASDATDSSFTNSWSFEMSVAPGVVDFAATNGTMIALRRDQELKTDFVESEVDLSTEGLALLSSSFALPDILAGETVSTFEGLGTPNNTIVNLPSTASTFSVLPNSISSDGDSYSVSILVSGTGEARTVSGSFLNVVPSSFSLLPVLSPANYSTTMVSAAWGALPDGYTTVGFSYQDSSNTQTVTVSNGWATSHSPTGSSFDSSFPGHMAMYDANPSLSTHLFAIEEISTDPNEMIYTSGLSD